MITPLVRDIFNLIGDQAKNANVTEDYNAGVRTVRIATSEAITEETKSAIQMMIERRMGPVEIKFNDIYNIRSKGV